MMTTAESDTASTGPARTLGGWLLAAAGVVLLGGYLLVCHGCHGDVDDELFAPANRGAGLPAGHKCPRMDAASRPACPATGGPHEL